MSHPSSILAFIPLAFVTALVLFIAYETRRFLLGIAVMRFYVSPLLALAKLCSWTGARLGDLADWLLTKVEYFLTPEWVRWVQTGYRGPKP